MGLPAAARTGQPPLRLLLLVLLIGGAGAQCSGARYVKMTSTVSYNGALERLGVAELRVFSPAGANIALNQPVALSASGTGPGSYCVDGNTATMCDPFPTGGAAAFLTVDLGAAVTVSSVTMVGRMDSYWGDNWDWRNNGAIITLLDASSNVLASATLGSPCSVCVRPPSCTSESASTHT